MLARIHLFLLLPWTKPHLQEKKETLSTQERWHRFYLMTVKALSCNNLTRLIELLRCVSCLYSVFRRKVFVSMEKNRKNEGAGV